MKDDSDKNNLLNIPEDRQYTPKEKREIESLILKKKIADYEMHKVRSMTLQQLLEKTRNKEPIEPPSPTQKHIHRQIVNNLKASGFEHNLEELAEKQMGMVKEAEQNRKLARRQMKEAPVFSQIKRGKLRFDAVLMLFAMFGSMALPYIFYKKFQKSKAEIVASRKYSPEIIQNISDDSPINIDAVSSQSIHYDNPNRRLQLQKLKEKAQKMSKLKRELDL